VCGEFVRGEISTGGQHVGYYCAECGLHEMQRLNGHRLDGTPLKKPYERVPAGQPGSTPPWGNVFKEEPVPRDDLVATYACLVAEGTDAEKLAALDEYMRSLARCDESEWREFLANDWP
jgi:hypothetical protein